MCWSHSADIQGKLRYSQSPVLPPSFVYGSAQQYGTSLHLEYKISSDWTATLIGQGSRELDDSSSLDIYPPPYTSSNSRARNYPFEYYVYGIEPRIDGKLFEAPGGSARLAVGGQYRRESFEQFEYVSNGDPPPPETLFNHVNSARHITSAYGELLVPIVGPNNSMALATATQDRFFGAL